MNFIRLLVALCVCALTQSALAQEFNARIIAVLDGDTVLVRRGGGTVKIRLAEVDAPEVAHAGVGTPDPQKAQPYGEDSRRSLSAMVLGKQVDVVTLAVDQYGRLVAKLSMDGLDVNAEQVRRGMAWAAVGWRQSGNHPLLALQAEARQARRGLWGQAQPVPPEIWRKQHPGAFMQESASQPPVGMPSDCGRKQYCSEMGSCAEARHYLTHCGVRSLDGNGDGVPCESLCAADKH